MKKVFSSAILGVSTLFLFWFLKRREKNVRFVNLKLARFNPAMPREKEQMFIQWCQQNGWAPRRCDPEELDEYALIFKLPMLNDWKEIHGYSRLDWVSRDVYMDWVKYIGAYNPKFDPEHPEWNGSLKDSF